MLSKKCLLLLLLVCAFGFYSCKEKTYLGESFTNYPDLKKILQDTWDQEVPYNYMKITFADGKKDSLVVPQNEMPWNEINGLFENANFHSEKLDKHYTINVMLDSITESQTLFYETLEPEDFTQSLDIVSSAESSAVNSIYIKINANGYLDAKTIKVLYIPKELIQIHKSKADGSIVETYKFPR